MPGQSLFAFQKGIKTLLKAWKGIRQQSVNAGLLWFLLGFLLRLRVGWVGWVGSVLLR